MLNLPDPTITFKGEEAIKFLKEMDYGLELLHEYLEDIATMSKDLLKIQASLLENPYI